MSDLSSMEFILYRAELDLPRLLSEREAWNSLFITYHPPVVERIWRDFEGYRLSVHRIHPCRPKDAFLHPHKWPGAFRVWGRYEMGIGWSDTLDPPKASVRIITTPGTVYTMTDPNVWHYVAPIDDEPVLTVMLTGKPWERAMPLEPEHPLQPLPTLLEDQLFGDILDLYEEEFHHDEP